MNRRLMPWTLWALVAMAAAQSPDPAPAAPAAPMPRSRLSVINSSVPVAAAVKAKPAPVKPAAAVAPPVAAAPAAPVAAPAPAPAPVQAPAPAGPTALFAARSWIKPPAEVLPMALPAVEQGPVRPSVPPLDISFLGSYAPEGDEAVYFLSRGERVYDVRVGSTIDDTYRVEAVEGTRLRLRYLPLDVVQYLAIGVPQ